MSNEITVYLRSISKIPMIPVDVEQKHARIVYDGKRKIVNTIKSKRSLNHLIQAIENIDENEKEVILTLIQSLTPDKLLILKQYVLESDFDVIKKYSSYSKKLSQLIDSIIKSREILITANLRLVISIAKFYSNRDIPLIDLIQEGNIGLIKAVDKFDPDRGAKLATFGTWWIRQAIVRSISNKAKIIRIPVHVIEAFNKAYAKLSETLNRAPTPEELQEKLNLSFNVNEIMDVINIMYNSVSLDTPIKESSNNSYDDITYEALLSDNASPVEDLLMDTDMRRLILEDLSHLSPREEKVVRLKLTF